MTLSCFMIRCFEHQFRLFRAEKASFGTLDSSWWGGRIAQLIAFSLIARLWLWLGQVTLGKMY